MVQQTHVVETDAHVFIHPDIITVDRPTHQVIVSECLENLDYTQDRVTDLKLVFSTQIDNIEQLLEGGLWLAALNCNDLIAFLRLSLEDDYVCVRIYFLADSRLDGEAHCAFLWFFADTYHDGCVAVDFRIARFD